MRPAKRRPAGADHAAAARSCAQPPNAAPAAPDDVRRAAIPALAGLSPAQRRAYELGYRDCSHGRYAPDDHLEAYRIGCGAAHDRMLKRLGPQG